MTKDPTPWTGAAAAAARHLQEAGEIPPMSYDPLEMYSDAGRGRLPGTEDWTPVVEIDDTVMYEWTTFRAYYSPSARRYFWHGDAGHSGHDWDDAIRSVGDFANGDRRDLRAALYAFAAHHDEEGFTAELPAALATIATFKETP